MTRLRYNLRTIWTAKLGRMGAMLPVLAMALAVLGGCDDTKERNALLTEENEGLRAQLDERNDALAMAHDEVREKNLQIMQLQQDLDSRQATAGPVDPFGSIPNVTGEVGVGQVTAIVEGDVLFASGKASLRSEAKRSLDAVARVIRNQYPGRTVRIAGHTDTDPIKKSGYSSNYHLGFERAYAVREYLRSQGIDGTYVASHGPDRAKSSKQASRRVEIVVELGS